MIGRIFLFILTNILVITTFSIICSIFGIGDYVTASGGIDFAALLVFCLVWGMVASTISLWMSRWTAKRFLGVKVVDPNAPGEYDWLVAMVHSLAQRANLPAMPEVGVFASDDVNAFATGPTKKRSLVAFSSGLLRGMSRQEIEGVAAHEIAHIQNGDMVTMTLLQGVINAFVMFFARIAAHFASQSVREELSGVVWFVTVIVFQIVFGILGSLVTCWFSRRREFRADAGSAKLAGRGSMIAALKALQNVGEAEAMPASMRALGIRESGGGIRALWSTHPSLADRIKALESYSAQ
ncbi:MAG: protease HtpX [Bdellovibrionales bacterium]|nr:protease HtpX [Bdellovibrionales bacterium]